jgi:hypothetical protein
MNVLFFISRKTPSRKLHFSFPLSEIIVTHLTDEHTEGGSQNLGGSQSLGGSTAGHLEEPRVEDVEKNDVLMEVAASQDALVDLVLPENHVAQRKSDLEQGCGLSLVGLYMTPGSPKSLER